MKHTVLCFSLFIFVLLYFASGDRTTKRLTNQVIPLSNCAELTEEGATYVLQADITHSVLPLASYCFLISAPSITLEGNGSAVILPFSDDYDCVSVTADNVTIRNIILQCKTGVRLTGVGARVLDTNVYFELAGISVYGNFSSLIGVCAQFGAYSSSKNCSARGAQERVETGPHAWKQVGTAPKFPQSSEKLSKIGSISSIARNFATRNASGFGVVGSPVGILVVNASGASVMNCYVYNCAGGLSTQGNAVGIVVAHARDTQVERNFIVNITGGNGMNGGGDAIGIIIQSSLNSTIYGNNIDLVFGGSGSSVSGAAGGDAFGIQILSSSAQVTSNVVTNIMGGNGSPANGSAGGKGGNAAAIAASTIFISSINGNNLNEITGGIGGNSSNFPGGTGGNASGIWVDEGECMSISGNNIGDIFQGIGGSSVSFPFAQNGEAQELSVPTNLTCQITDLHVIAPENVNASEMAAIYVAMFIYDYIPENFVGMCHFTTNDSRAQMYTPADQALPQGTFTFLVSFSDPGVVSVEISCNGTRREVLIAVLPGPLCKPAPVTFSRYGRDYIEVNWRANTSYEKCELYFSRDLKMWNNVTLGSNISSYILSSLDSSTTYYFYITLSDANGTSGPSDIANFTTTAEYCGDGICDSNENCTGCYFDCTHECGRPACLFECFGNSVCVGGSCQCEPSMYGPSCSNSSTATNISIQTDDATVVISQLAVSANFYIISREIYEVDKYGNIVASIFSFDGTPYTATSNISTTLSQYQVVFTLPNNATVEITSQLSTDTYQTLFGGRPITILPGVVKLWIKIENWEFSDISNRLVLKMSYNTNGSSTVTKWEGAGNNLLWSQLKTEFSSLYVTYNEDAVLDNELRKVQFLMGNDTAILLQIPHFWNSAEIDPNFSVLINLPTKSGNSGKANGKKNYTKPVVVIPVVVAIVVIALVAVIAKWVMVRLRKKNEKSNLHAKVRASQLIVPDSADDAILNKSL